MPKENYIAKIDNVECVIAFVNAPKDPKKGYSYTLNIKNPPKELTPYLSGKYNSIYMYTYDESPRFSSKQTITIAKLGITEWEGSDGTKKYSAHAITPEKQEVFKGTKELPTVQLTETVGKDPKQEMWDCKEYRGHIRALTATILASCFAPRTNEDGIEPMDRITCALDLAEIALERIYNVSKKI